MPNTPYNIFKLFEYLTSLLVLLLICFTLFESRQLSSFLQSAAVIITPDREYTCILKYESTERGLEQTPGSGHITGAILAIGCGGRETTL